MEVAGELVERAQGLEQEAVRKAEGAIDDALTDALAGGGGSQAGPALAAGVAEEVARARRASQLASSARPITLSSRIGLTPSKIGNTVASTT